MGRIVSSYLNSAVSKAEDPEKILDQAVNEIQSDLIRMRQASAQVLASQKQLSARYDQAQKQADDWYQRAELALAKGEDDLAREALKRKKTYQNTADSLKGNLQQSKQATDQIISNTRMLENKLAEAKNKKDTLKARAASAKTSKQIQEMVGSIDTSSSVAAFERMEEKVMALESESEAIGQLAAGDELEQKFTKLQATDIDSELEQMKAGNKRQIGSQQQQQQQLPAGRPYKEAVDFELEELRRKVRE